MKTKILITLISITIIITIIGTIAIIYVSDTAYNPIERISCESNGGTYEMIGEVWKYSCIMPVKDEGNSCTDSSQCIEICVAETGEDTTGMCTGYYNTGCYFWEMSNGKAHEACIVN